MRNTSQINWNKVFSGNAIYIILLMAVSFLIYSNSLGGDYIIDDIARIQNNKHIHDLGAYFSNHFRWDAGSFHEAMLAVIWHMSGGRPFGFHLYNVILHVFCVILVFALCMALFKNRLLSFLASLIFAVHPIHTEAVSWISGNPYLLSSLFYLGVFVSYLKAKQERRYYLLCASLLFVGFLFAQEVILVPFMIIAYELFFNSGKDFFKKEKWPLLILSAAVISISVVALISLYISRAKYSHMIFTYRGWRYLIVAIKAFSYYLKILYLPLARGLYHPFAFTTVSIDKVSPLFFVSIFIALSLIILCFKTKNKLMPVSFGIMWFFIAYLPYSNLVPICNIISERYMYLSSVGICIVLAALFLKAWDVINSNTKYKKAFRYVAIIVMVLFLSSYATLTLSRNYEYHNIITYWWSNINNFQDGYIVYNNLAGTFYAMGDLDNALAYSYTNLMSNRFQPHVWCNLGKIYTDLKDFDQAAYCYKQALEIDENYFPAIKSLEGIELE
ncbi:tetratricopeptide repeat protein [Candidatus Omnitrophota bacterium]